MRWEFFVLGAVLSWGCYGPSLHAGQTALGSGVRALLFVGLAYFLVAVLVPGAWLATQPEPGQFTGRGVAISTLAGILGAAGAVFILFAFKNGGTPLIVMPLVFGGAPLINVAVTMATHPPKTAPHPLLYAGFAMAAVGAFMVLYFKPK